MITEKDNTMYTEEEIDKLDLVREMKATMQEPRPFKPAPRVRQPWRGALNWKKHKARQAKKRRDANRRGKRTRKAQRRAS